MKTGLLGRHIAYSRSPEIHEELYRQRRLPLTYELFDLPREELQRFIDTLDTEKIVGFNVTIPYKETIFDYIHELDETALEVGAVNTVVIKDGWRTGHNTDIYGFMQSLEDFRIPVKGKDVLILGSGGAAKAVYAGLKRLGARIHMAFRSEARRVYFPEALTITPLSEMHDLRPYALVINCTKLGNVNQDVLPLAIDHVDPSTVFYDVNYLPLHSAFLRYGFLHGLQVINGESMLLNQAKKAQELWIEALRLF